MSPPARVVLYNEQIATVIVIGGRGIGINPVHRARYAGAAKAGVIDRVASRRGGLPLTVGATHSSTEVNEARHLAAEG